MVIYLLLVFVNIEKNTICIKWSIIKYIYFKWLKWISSIKTICKLYKNITKGLSGKEFLKLGEISKDILGNAKRDIGIIFDNTSIQIEEERQVSENLIDHTNKIVNSKEFEKSLSNDLAPEKINQFFEGYETITNNFVDEEKNEFLEMYFLQNLSKLFLLYM